MLSKYEKKINDLKENLIYAVNENYEGEFEIEDVTDSAYYKMLLEQDKKVIDESSYFYAEAASKLIEVLENYCDNIKESNRKTVFRNSEIVEETLEDLCRAITILTLSIRKNNADWQVKLDKYLDKEENDSPNNNLGEKLTDLFKNLEITLKGDEENEEK